MKNCLIMSRSAKEWPSPQKSLPYLNVADSLPHRSDGESVLIDHLPENTKRVLDLGIGDGRLIKLISMLICVKFLVGYKVTNDEFNILQAYANEMYNFQVPDPQTNSTRRMIEEPNVRLLIKEAVLHTLDNSTY